MTAVLLSIHVLAAVVLVGPMTAASSLFPRYARSCLHGSPAELGTVRALHRITSGYAVPAVAVPVFGVGTAVRLGVLGQAWVLSAMALTLGAALLLGAVIVPAQQRVVALLRRDGSDERAAETSNAGSGADAVLARLARATGLFSLTWAAVVVLMIVRPGSTTGV